MSNLITILALTRAQAMFEITIMLLVAFLIGFIVAWLYYRNKYQAKVREAETALQNANADLKTAHARIEALEAQVKKLSEVPEEVLSEEELSKIEKVKKENQSLRRQLMTLHTRLGEAEIKMGEIEGDSEIKTALAMPNESENSELKNENQSLKVKIDELEKQLKSIHAHELELEKEVHDKNEALAALSARKHELDFESFGKATADEKNDLTIIKGIGPFIEEKLNALDIYTFRQIAAFTDKDVVQVTKVIEFFPGRIQRDHWVEQAKALIEGQEVPHFYTEKNAITEFQPNLNSANVMISKEIVDGKRKVLFRLPKEVVGEAKGAKVLGEFNNWDPDKGMEMVREPDGTMEAEMELEVGKNYEFRYLLDHERWENDWSANKYVYIPEYHVDNSVIVLSDNLAVVEGIGPKIAQLLNKANIYTFKQLAEATVEDLKQILVDAGGQFHLHNPTSWPEQAQLAADGKWEDLKTWQDEHVAGRV